MMPSKSPTSTRARRIASTLQATCRRLRVARVLCWSMIGAVGCGAPPRVPNTVVMASGTDLESGNPLVTVHSLTRQIQRHALFVTLVRLDSLMQPVPYFARRWQVDSSQRIVTMTLHPQLTWHDGTPTTAADVRFTLDAARDPEVGSPRAGELAALDSVRTPADTVVVLYFAAPQRRLPTVLAELPLVPAHLLNAVPRATWRSASFATAPVGNGPFRFVSREAGRRWRFVRNDAFPPDMGGPPALAGFVVAVVDEAATKFAGLVSGELDIAGVSPSMAHLVRDDPTLTLLTPPALFSNVLALNTTRAPFNDRRVREAIALSIDRPRLVQAAVAGYATPAGSAIPPGLPMSGSAPARYDTARADALLDSAGYRRTAGGQRARNGQPLQVEMLTVGSGDMAIEQLIQADLRSRGITVTLRVAELTTFLSAVRAVNKQFDLAITGIPGDIGAGQLSALFASAQRGGALDYTGFHDPRLDAALLQAREAPVGQQREAWASVDSMLMRESPVVWLYHARGVQGLSRRLAHVTMDLRGELVTVAQWTRP